MSPLKSICIALVALLAIGTQSAAAASYRSESGKTFFQVVQEGNQVITTGAATTCTGFSAEGEFASPAASLTLTGIAYSGCTGFGGAITVNMHGCDFKLKEPTGAASPFSVKEITIVCPAGGEIVFTRKTTECTEKWPAQTTTGTSTVTNLAGSPKMMRILLKIPQIREIGSGGICGTGESISRYEGTVLLKGFKNLGHSEATGVFVE